jgi:hypothetical protein
MDEDEFLALYTGQLDRPIHVCRIEDRLARHMQANTTAVWLSRWTIEKQWHKHRDMHAPQYGFLPIVLRYGIVIDDRPRHLTFIYNDTEIFGRPFKATIKATELGTEIYVQSFHFMRPRHIPGRLKRATILRDWPEETA